MRCGRSLNQLQGIRFHLLGKIIGLFGKLLLQPSLVQFEFCRAHFAAVDDCQCLAFVDAIT